MIGGRRPIAGRKPGDLRLQGTKSLLPTLFTLVANREEMLHFSEERRIENLLREDLAPVEQARAAERHLGEPRRDVALELGPHGGLAVVADVVRHTDGDDAVVAGPQQERSLAGLDGRFAR